MAHGFMFSGKAQPYKKQDGEVKRLPAQTHY